MGALDTFMPGVAKKVVALLGTTAVLTQRAGDYEPTNGESVTSEKSVPIGITPPEPYSEENIDGTAVKIGDMHIFAIPPVTGEVPKIDDEVTFGGDILRIISVGKIMTGSEIALYELQCRK